MDIGILFSGLLTYLKRFTEKVKKSPLIKKNPLTKKGPQIKKNPQTRIILMAAGGMAAVILVLLVILLVVSHRPAKPAAPPDAADSFRPLAFPPEDFFLPDEPDFLPEVLLEKEPRESWTAGDARPYWTDPMEADPDGWRKRIQSGVDQLLERVP
jgi:hypothetical protein